jgi:hypothetical protein
VENRWILRVAMAWDSRLDPLLCTIVLVEAWIHYRGAETLVEIQSSSETSRGYSNSTNP